ncbi:hypothetical protein ACJJTC_001347 [Scirpophaga incertulas]
MVFGKCVLFPKLQSLGALRHDIVYEFIPMDNELLPVDFLSSQWVDKSACYLPTYVPLLSGIFGLVWTTMFLMCSTGSRTLTGLQRPWRILPPVFIFSLAMSGLCIYSSTVTQSGLQELCLKLGEITGSATCTYTVNVATLVYERRIRGVYQAIRLTITSAWLHTICWLLSAAVALARVILAVDFQLVRVKVELVGDIDKVLEQQEDHIRTVSPDIWIHNELTPAASSKIPIHSINKVHFTDASINTTEKDIDEASNSDILYFSKIQETDSVYYLVPTDNNQVSNLSEEELTPDVSVSSLEETIQSIPIMRQKGQENVNKRFLLKSSIGKTNQPILMEPEEAEKWAKKMRLYLKKMRDLSDKSVQISSSKTSFIENLRATQESELNITIEMRNILNANKNLNISDNNSANSEKNVTEQSNLQHISIQTDEAEQSTSHEPNDQATKSPRHKYKQD